MTSCLRSISVRREGGPRTTVSWFPGSSSESIEVTCKAAVEVAADAMILAIDDDGCVVALTEHVPEGTVLRIEVVGEADAEGDAAQPLLEDDDASRQFDAQLLKFERISAHLSNERTWLAWIRTALALVSVGFTLRAEADNDDRRRWRIVYFVAGCLFLLCVDLTWLTGWFRYRRTKDILLMPKDELATRKFNRLSVRVQAQFLGALLVATGAIFVAGGWKRTL